MSTQTNSSTGSNIPINPGVVAAAMAKLAPSWAELIEAETKVMGQAAVSSINATYSAARGAFAAQIMEGAGSLAEGVSSGVSAGVGMQGLSDAAAIDKKLKPMIADCDTNIKAGDPANPTLQMHKVGPDGKIIRDPNTGKPVPANNALNAGQKKAIATQATNEKKDLEKQMTDQKEVAMKKHENVQRGADAVAKVVNAGVKPAAGAMTQNQQQQQGLAQLQNNTLQQDQQTRAETFQLIQQLAQAVAQMNGWAASIV